MTTTTASTFNKVYRMLIDELFTQGTESVSRKGKKLTELYDKKFTVLDPRACMATCREMSTQYLEDEFAFYMSGSNKLDDAVKCSPFWKNCSDDGETINSNYGKLLFHDRNKAGNTQFEHAIKCLKNSQGSKKAVMTIYDKENAYMSNDNPCTMFLRARIDDWNKLHLTTYMRSSDIFFGLPYDVPFFVFVQSALIDHLSFAYPDISMGTYTHIASSLHFYEYKRDELNRALEMGTTISAMRRDEEVYTNLVEAYLPVTHQLVRTNWMSQAWKAANRSECLKKKVGCVFTQTKNGVETFLTDAHGGVASHRPTCKVCVRDDPDDRWFETGCWSVHSEHRALDYLRISGANPNFAEVTVYVTHGPCDACLKMMDLVGITKVYYDVEYKTDYSHWPNMTIKQIGDKV